MCKEVSRIEKWVASIREAMLMDYEIDETLTGVTFKKWGPENLVQHLKNSFRYSLPGFAHVEVSGSGIRVYTSYELVGYWIGSKGKNVKALNSLIEGCNFEICGIPTIKNPPIWLVQKAADIRQTVQHLPPLNKTPQIWFFQHYSKDAHGREFHNNYIGFDCSDKSMKKIINFFNQGHENVDVTYVAV